MFSADVIDAKTPELAEKWTSPRPWAFTVTVLPKRSSHEKQRCVSAERRCVQDMYPFLASKYAFPPYWMLAVIPRPGIPWRHGSQQGFVAPADRKSLWADPFESLTTFEGGMRGGGSEVSVCLPFSIRLQAAAARPGLMEKGAGTASNRGD